MTNFQVRLGEFQKDKPLSQRNKSLAYFAAMSVAKKKLDNFETWPYKETKVLFRGSKPNLKLALRYFPRTNT